MCVWVGAQAFVVTKKIEDKKQMYLEQRLAGSDCLLKR